MTPHSDAPIHATSAHGWLEFLGLAALWGASFLFTRHASVSLGPLPTATGRVAVAALALLPLVIWQGQWSAMKQHWRKLLLVGMLNSGIPFACYAFAVLHLSTGTSAILNAATPLFGGLIAWFWLKERLTVGRVLGLALGFSGVAMLTLHQNHQLPHSTAADAEWMNHLAIIACLTATFCYGISASYAKKHLQGLPPLATATGSLMGAFVGLLLPTLWLLPSEPVPAKAWWSLLAVGVLCTALAYVLYYKLIRDVGPAKAISVTFLIPVFAVAYGHWFLSEAITLPMLGWGLWIIVGTSLATGLWPRAEKKKL